MNDRTRHLLHRAGDIAPWVVGVLAVGAVLVPVAGGWSNGGEERPATSAMTPRRISFQRPLRSAVHPRLRAPAAAATTTATAASLAFAVTPDLTAPTVSIGRGASTTRPPKGRSLPAGFPTPGKSYVFLDQPARKAGAATVAVIGDSLTVGASPGFQVFLSDVNLRLDARVSRPTLEGVQAAASTKASSAGVVVVALGSNDSCGVSECRRRVDSVLAAIGPKPRIVWMPPATFRPNMAAMRSAISAAAKQSKGRITVLDWQPYLDDNPQITTADGIHLTPEGYRLRAQVSADEVHRLVAGA